MARTSRLKAEGRPKPDSMGSGRCWSGAVGTTWPRRRRTPRSPKPPDRDEWQSSVIVGGPCKRGDETQKRDAAMGNYSALNYAAAVGFPRAKNATWEWLHLVGAALGGGNVMGNLVAGTYDSNTPMIPMEQSIVEYSNRRDAAQDPIVTAQHPIRIVAKAKLWKEERAGRPTWIAETITLEMWHQRERVFWLGPNTSLNNSAASANGVRLL